MCWFESSVQENIQHISISSGAAGHPSASSRAAQRSSVGLGAMNRGASPSDSSSENKHRVLRSGKIRCCENGNCDPRLVSELCWVLAGEESGERIDL